MCDLQGKLIAWLDRELPSEEADGVERHLEECQECRNRLAAYRELSETFGVYCDAVVAAKTDRRVPRWVPVLVSAIAAASRRRLSFRRLPLLLSLFPRRRRRFGVHAKRSTGGTRFPPPRIKPRNGSRWRLPCKSPFQQKRCFRRAPCRAD
jgi:anti-sigma factor RsiW